jgi:hypothetical protein
MTEDNSIPNSGSEKTKMKTIARIAGKSKLRNRIDGCLINF